MRALPPLALWLLAVGCNPHEQLPRGEAQRAYEAFTRSAWRQVGPGLEHVACAGGGRQLVLERPADGEDADGLYAFSHEDCVCKSITINGSWKSTGRYAPEGPFRPDETMRFQRWGQLTFSGEVEGTCDVNEVFEIEHAAGLTFRHHGTFCGHAVHSLLASPRLHVGYEARR